MPPPHPPPPQIGREAFRDLVDTAVDPTELGLDGCLRDAMASFPGPRHPLPDLRGGVGFGTGGRLVWFVGLVGAVLERGQMFGGVCDIGLK